MRYELKIEVLDDDYVDDLIICLARQGYAPYLSIDRGVCVTVDSDDMHEIKEA